MHVSSSDDEDTEHCLDFDPNRCDCPSQREGFRDKSKGRGFVLNGGGEYFLSSMWEMVKDGSGSKDFSLEFQDKHTLLVNNLVLASMSPYFQAMLESEMRETVEKKIKLPTLSRMTFTRMLAFTLGQEVELESREELVELLETADMMQMKALVTAGVELLERRLAVDNCLETLAIIRRFGLEAVATENFIRRRMGEIAQTEGWPYLEEDALLAIIESSQDTCALCEGVLSWLEGTKADGSTAARLLSMVQIENLLDEDIQEVLTTHPSVLGNEVVMEAVQQRLQPKGEITLLVIASSSIKGSACARTCLYSWSDRDRQWSTLPSPPEPFPEDFAVTVHRDFLHICGGLAETASRKSWTLSDSTWTEGPLLNTGRYRHGTAAVNKLVYAVGGCPGPLKSIEINFRNYFWEEVICLPEAVCDCGVAALGENVIVVGGSDTQGPKNIIQYFNIPTYATAVLQSSLPIDSGINLGYTRCAGVMRGAYFLSGSGHLLKVLENEDPIIVDNHVHLKDFDHKSPFVAILDRGGVVVCDSLAADCRYSLDGEKKEETSVIGRLPNDLRIQSVIRYFHRKSSDTEQSEN